jgi:hypothetical protein
LSGQFNNHPLTFHTVMTRALFLILIILLPIAVAGCHQFNSSRSGDEDPGQEKQLTKIPGFPEEIVGCSCYLSENIEDLKNRKFLYLEKYGAVDPEKNISIVSIDEKTIKFKTGQPPPEFKIELFYDENIMMDQEVFNRSGILKVTFRDGTVVKKNFVGICGC